MNIGTEHIQIFVRDNDHPPPHFHVRRKDKTESRVVLPTLKILSGPPLSKVERKLVLERLELICDAYESKNPKKHKSKDDE